MQLTGLRLLMTADTVGGVWHYAVDLARHLTDYGVETVLATMGAPLNDEQWREARSVPNLRVVESDFRLEWMDEPWADVAAAGRWLLDLERRLQPDLVQLNNYAHASLPWRVPVLVVGHSCVVSWWRAVHGCAPPASFDRYQRAVREGLTAANRVVAPSRTMRDALQTYYGPLHRTRVIYNGRHPNDYRAGRKQPQILSAGRLWDAAKNIQTVAAAAEGLPWPVRVAGETRHPDGGEIQLKNVEFLGRLPPKRMRACYAESTVYAFPARYEPFGLSVLEAALSGCVLLLGDIRSLRELWDGAALFVAPKNAAEVRQALWQVIDDGPLRSRLKTAARKRARRYSLEGTVASYSELYAEMLGLLSADAVRGSQPRIGS